MLTSPHPLEIIRLRKTAKLTQTQAGALVHGSLRAWQQWEAGDRSMSPGLWELFCLKLGVTPPLKMRQVISPVAHLLGGAPDAQQHKMDASYLRRLIALTGMSQRLVAKKIGIADQTLRSYLSHADGATRKKIPYTVQYALENLAAHQIGKRTITEK